ncbi:hypothetical protein WJ438_17645 [Streptomyces sp. GD-15H]|uniref:hypothetical protein n=1 Tax=Streptomyces sp. GD-15H TaxID=3129112 RepID=UPI00324302CD
MADRCPSFTGTAPGRFRTRRPDLAEVHAAPLPEAVGVRAGFKAPVLLPGAVTYGAQGGCFELRGPGDRLHLTGEVRPA